MVKKAVIIGLIFIILISMTGCWNKRPLAQMKFATAIAFDKTKDDKIETTVQIVKPSVVGAKEGGGGEEAVWSSSYSGETVFESLRGVLTAVSQKIFVGHINLIVVNEDLAKDSIVDVIDFYSRDHETNRKAQVLIAKGVKAKKVIKATSKLEDIPSEHILGILSNNTAVARIKQVELFDLLNCFSTAGLSPAIGVVQPKDKQVKAVEDLRVQGTAVFKKDKLVGWLEPTETRGLLFIQNEVKSGIINVANPKHKDKQVAFEIVSSQAEKKAKIEEGELKFTVEVTAKGRLGGQQGARGLIKPKMINKLELKVKDVIKRDIRQAIKLAQEKYQTDIFGFSKEVQKEDWVYWKEIEENWEQVFSQAAVEIKVTWETKGSGRMEEGVRIK